MFRDPSLYRTLREQVVPILRSYPQIKIWHAGCAAGEEVYTTAILLAEEGLYERSQIYATDMSLRAVEQAREGVYPETEVETFKANYERAGGAHAFEAYYLAAYGRIAVREALRKNVVFFQHDLVSDYVLGEMQLIFCRNVLIYFGAELRERVVATLSRGLCHGGFLCLGGSEHLPASQSPFFSEFSAADRVYRWRGLS
jgi:chemotaxis protein methyltransferase CheR